MSENRDGSPSSKSRNDSSNEFPSSPRADSPAPSSHIRHASTARLASPVPSASITGTSPVKQVPTPFQIAADEQTQLPTVENASSLPGPGQSALAAALANDDGRRLSRTSTPPKRTSQPNINPIPDNGPKGNYGSFNPGSVQSGLPPFEDPEVVKRHLVQPNNGTARYGSPLRVGTPDVGTSTDGDEFSSLRLQGGDITRQVYRWSEDHEGSIGRWKGRRSKSFDVARPEPENEMLDIDNIKMPGGFRRNYLRRTAESPTPSHRNLIYGTDGANESRRGPRPKLLTNNFLEFLTLYGHFAGEELEEDDEVLEPDEYFSAEAWEEQFADVEGDGSDREPGEGSALLTPGTPGRRKRKPKERGGGNNTTFGAALLLLKSFVGTGVLFLPKAFLNGGMLFSCLVLLGVACLSYYCFILLVNTRLKIDGSFGDIGGVLYGKHLRALILASIVLSQVGFVAAYVVFTAENLQAFVLAVSSCKSFIDIKFIVLMQLVIFLPLSLIRDISKLGFTALIADAFILLGLIYLYYYDISTIAYQGGVSDIAAFNPGSWTLFIGTAIFTFEGVGLIIPIQESMRQPKRFPGVLALVMVIITVIFLSMGALSYAAFGSATKTVVILNLPQDDKFVNGVQFLYSLAILLSTPLQLFPAIRILENELFSKSGKYNPYIKWQKNVFRFFLVFMCALIAWGGAGDLDKFVALVGSFACVPLVYVYPPLLHLKAVATTRRQRIADIALACFGVVGCCYTTALTVVSWVNGAVQKAPGYCDS